MDFSTHLKELRKKHKITQLTLAKSIELTDRGYRNIELGISEPNMTTLIAIADFYKISLDELVCRTIPK